MKIIFCVKRETKFALILFLCEPLKGLRNLGLLIFMSDLKLHVLSSSRVYLDAAKSRLNSQQKIAAKIAAKIASVNGL